MQDGNVVATVPALGGKPGYETPTGVFTVDFHSKDHVSSIYDAPMPYSVFFHKGSAFHEGSLTAPSHGCVHLDRDAAIKFYEFLRDGDQVESVA